MKRFIVKSGSGYLLNKATLEMISDPSRDVNAALQAERLSLSDASDVVDMFSATGFDAQIIELRIGELHQ